MHAASERGVGLRAYLNKATPDDVVGAVFAYSGEEVFTSNKRFLQGFFHELAQSEPYHGMLDDFEFSLGRDPYPFSRELEESLGRLQLGKIIYARNPEYDHYGMTDEGRLNMQAIAERVFDSGELMLLQEAADEFRRQAESARLERENAASA